jgi:hypothetical protein
MTSGKDQKVATPGRYRSDFQITINSREDGDWGGQVEHIPTGMSAEFKNLGELVLSISDRLDKTGFPQSATEMRSWKSGGGLTLTKTRGETVSKKPDAASRRGVRSGAPTFFVRIHYRENATWQGSIQWLETGGTRYFRSALELINLMQEAIDLSRPAEAAAEPPSWQDHEELSG